MTLPQEPPRVPPPRQGGEGPGPIVTDALATPVTTLTCVAAVALSYLRWQSPDGMWGMPIPGLMGAEPWRWITKLLLHGSWMHLLSNLLLLWYFGRLLELRLGALRTLAVYVLTGLGSGAAQLTLSGPGIGLSGIGFAVFTYLLVASKRDARFAGAIERRAVIWIAGWFVLCVVMTYTGAWNIGNVAHAAGALFGALLAIAASSRAPRLATLGIAALALSLAAGGTELRSHLPVGDAPSRAFEAWRAVEHGHAARAERLALRATQLDPSAGSAWEVLGVARIEDDRPREAVEPLRRAIELYEGSPGAVDLGRAWWNLGIALRDAGQPADAHEALETARSYGFTGSARRSPEDR